MKNALIPLALAYLLLLTLVGSSCTGISTASLNQNSGLAISTRALPTGTVGTPYASTLAATGGTQPYAWSISTGSLPSGLTLSGISGSISGTPTSAGQFSFTVTVTDSSSSQQTSTQALQISVSGPSPLKINTLSVPDGVMGVAYSATLIASGGTQSDAWSISSGSLPPGLALTAPSGAISGTPTSAGQYTFTAKVTDSGSPQQLSTQALTMSVAASAAPPVQVYPGQDIASIVSANPAGTPFVINPGTYRLQSPINAKDGDVFLGPCAKPPCALSGQAVLNGSRLLTSFEHAGSYYYVTGQTQAGRVTITSDKCMTGYSGCIYPEDLYFDDVPLTHVTARAEVGPGSWFFDYVNHIIYFYDNPSGHKVETSVAEAAFDPGPANNVTVQGLTVEKFATPALTGAIGGAGTGVGSSTAGASWVVQDNEIRLNHSYGVRINFGWQILGNYTHMNGNLGIGGGLSRGGSGTLSSNVLIQGNEIAYNNYAHFASGFQAGGAKIAASRSMVIRGNYVHDNNGPGLWADVGDYDILYDNNTVANNTEGGIAHEISYASLVRNNRLLKNGYTIPSATSWLYGANLLSSTSQGLEAYCNTVEVSAQGGNAMDILVQPRSAGENQLSSNNYFHHNTVTFDGDSGITGGAWAPSSEQSLFVNNNFDYNNYYLPDLSRKAFAWNSKYNTFADFQLAGQEAHGMAATLTSSSVPTVKIDSPADQSQVAGVVQITGSASDPSSVNGVEFYVDWALQTTASGDSFSFAWDTSTASAGQHTITAMAYNSEGIRACYGVTLNVP